MLKTYLALGRSDPRRSWLLRVRADAVRFRTDHPELFQVDGDAVTVEADRITVDRDAVRVLVKGL